MNVTHLREINAQTKLGSDTFNDFQLRSTSGRQNNMSTSVLTQIGCAPTTLEGVVRSGLCIGCGICAYSDAVAKMRYSNSRAQYVPEITDANRDDAFGYKLCPGKGYNILDDSARLYSEAQYDPDLGRIHSYCAAYSNDSSMLANASSGGVMSQLALYLLESKYVDRVLVTHFIYDSGVRASCVLAKSRDDIVKSQGSKYCPVDLSNAVREIKANNYKVAVVGTPCQIAGIRNIQAQDASFSDKVLVTIGTFCGGVKSYRNMDLLARRHGIEPRAISSFRFRGKGQPGSMLIESVTGKAVEIPYPKYVGHTGISKHLRCHLCVDATGELADIACGDAWIPRFLESPNPWSLILTRNRWAAELIEQMAEKGLLTTATVSLEEIKQSQRENLASKKLRQKSRRHLYGLLRFPLPVFDGGYRDNVVTLSTELRVLVKHRFKALLEAMHVFYPIYKLLK